MLTVGCQRTLVSTPDLYASDREEPFASVHPDLQSNAVEVVYVTDRRPAERSDPSPRYYA